MIRSARWIDCGWGGNQQVIFLIWDRVFLPKPWRVKTVSEPIGFSHGIGCSARAIIYLGDMEDGAEMAKAIIGITDWSTTRATLLELARRVDAGEQLPAADYRLDFANPVALLESLPPKRLETLRAIRTLGAVSIYALAKHLGRNYSNIHTDVARLMDVCLCHGKM